MAKLIVATKLCELCEEFKSINEFFRYTNSARYTNRKTTCKTCLQIKRFWSYVLKSEACWVWTGMCNQDGYGQFDHTSAHRFSWVLHNGAIDSKSYVLHHCDNPPCVRPNHLYRGSKKNNYDDMIQRGRASQEFLQCQQASILTAEIVLKAREMYQSKNLSHKEIWQMLNLPVAQVTLSQAISGITWKHL